MPKKTRRGRNEGTIRWIEGKQLWQARYPIGVDEKGRTKHKSIYGRKNEKGKLLAQMRDALAALGKGEYVDPSGEQLYTWCKEWVEVYKKPKIKPNTQAKYDTSLIRLKRYDIANIRLKDVNVELLQKFYNRLSSDGFSEETIKATHSLINGALDKAEDLNKIIKNPAKKTSIPKTFCEEEEVKALTVKQCDAFMYQIGRRTKHYMYALVMLNTGLRPGEAVALTRSDVDLKKNTIKVTKTYLEKEKKIQNSTKTTSSRRTVPIPEDTVKLLKLYMLKQPKKKPTDPLFQTKTGKRPTMSYMRKRFKYAGVAIGCDWINLHTMRHTFASRLFAKKVDPKIISKLLGHADVSTTYNIYVHFIDNIVEESVNILNEDITVPESLPKKSNSKPDSVRELKKQQKVAIK